MKITRGRPFVEQITYAPGLQTTNDLEAATKTITATVEATGVGNADYSAALTMAAPSDARLVVQQIMARLSITIDSMTAGTLYGRVYVDAQAANNRLFDLSWTTTGNKLAIQHTTAATLATIFALLKDGAAHTFYFFFWVNAGNTVLSVVQAWEGVGGGSGAALHPIALTYTGSVSLAGYMERVGTGTFDVYAGVPLNQNPLGLSQYRVWNLNAVSGCLMGGDSATIGMHPPILVLTGISLMYSGFTVATDISYIRDIGFLLRSN